MPPTLATGSPVSTQSSTHSKSSTESKRPIEVPSFSSSQAAYHSAALHSRLPERRKGSTGNVSESRQAAAAANHESDGAASLASMQNFRQALGWIDEESEQSSVEAYRQKLDIDCTGIAQSVSELSGGNQQKVIISRWLMKDCKVLLFDEPTRGIDIQTREAIYRLLYDLAAQGKAIVIVSSEIRELTTICDRIAVLSNGRLAADFQRDEWSAEKIMAASFSAYTDDAAA